MKNGMALPPIALHRFASMRQLAKLFAMSSHVRSLLIVVGVALALTFLFWWPLYRGAGFIGGDLYHYFFPQKAFYADCLKAGTFPLWNDLSGFGYPVLGESQTGAAYPFHFVLYYLFDLNTAYNIEHLLHYLICFVGTWLFAKRLGLSQAGAYLAAVVFTYGWFPPRACLEWAILSGSWLPVALWCVESFIQTRWWRYAIGLSVTLGLQLLAGHFHLAFITQLLVVTYSAWRLFSERRRSSNDGAGHDGNQSQTRVAMGLVFALIAGASLASIQLLPTWELKQRSTRVITGGEYDPAYGHMPPLYASQAIIPWCWYSLMDVDEDNLIRDIAEFVAPWHWFGPLHDAENSNKPYELDRAIQQHRFASLGAGTNKVEAHFYSGIIPLWMALFMAVTLVRQCLSRTAQTTFVLRHTAGYWLLAGLFALLYATGFLVPIGRHLPGFSFFRGPGRYGIVPTMTIALLAGQMLSLTMERITARSWRVVLMILIFGSTCGDLWLVSRMVKYAVMVSPPRISYRNNSEIRQRLLAEPNPPRLLAPGPNVGNMLGVSCVPWYLGMAPSEYVDPQNAMPPVPQPLANHQPTPGTAELTEWLSRSGVTHVLNFEPLDEPSWQVELVWKGVDHFLNHVWGRQEPIYLYRFRPSQADEKSPKFPGRAYTLEGNGRVTIPNWTTATPDSRRIKLVSDPSDPSTLVLTELAYPGWTVRQGSTERDATVSGMFRAVELADGHGEIVWTYRPRSVYYGAIVSLVTVILLALVAHVKFWHPTLVNRVVASVFPNRDADGS